MTFAYFKTLKETMKIIKYGGELHKFGCRVVIYGMGEYGKTLYSEASALGSRENLFVCDSNKSICAKHKNRIQKEALGGFSKKNPDAVIVISVQKEAIASQIYEDIVSSGWNPKKIYQYIPETKEEFKERKMKEGFFNGQENVFIMEDDTAGALIEAMVKQNKPFLVSRWGSVEGTAVIRQKGGVLSEIDLKFMYNNAGIFPVTDSGVKEFIEVTEHAAGQIDILCAGFWCRQIEALFRMLSPNALWARNAILPPCDKQWTEVLKGKKVLVIHPFALLIEKQYRKREKLFNNHRMLPEFKLSTYQAVQSMGGSSQYASWAEALEKMERDIAEMDFDIALIGCGAYGMPLGAFIKEKLKKQALHIGGQLQLLFGIKGGRWDVREDISSLYNEYWVRPTADLRPYNYKLVEDGCYW